MGNQRTIEGVAKWRTPPGMIEPPAWVRVYVATDWTDFDAWLSACEGWFNAHPEADTAHWAWILSLPDEPFNPYGESA
jgi:hypothetical protein